MNEMERLIWAGVFAAEWSKERKFREENTSSQPGWHDPASISGFSCAEVADVAVEAYREAVTGDNGEYLLPVKESWPSL